jgi:hypothetical protein
MLLTLSNLCAFSYGVQQDTDLSLTKLNAHSFADHTNVNLLTATSELVAVQYSPAEQTDQTDKVLVLAEEEEESESFHVEKDAFPQALQAQKSLALCRLPLPAFSAHSVPADEHLNSEKIYLLHLVFRI